MMIQNRCWRLNRPHCPRNDGADTGLEDAWRGVQALGSKRAFMITLLWKRDYCM